ncbi:MAG TPA: hypothetical protein VK524_04865 [Polyangiaceae bacterium]|nr:hypothetical protein [Polyangiaceae bacterium]
MIPSSHHGSWSGPNRLWFEGPEPERSDGRIAADATTINYTWSFRGAAQQGVIRLFGPDSALRCEWTDTWHAKDGMALHGCSDENVVVFYGTYPAGDGPEWGWRIKLDFRDPEHLLLRMFNCEPGKSSVLAVDLRGER